MSENLSVDDQVLKTFVPINSMVPELVSALACKSSASVITAGRYIFKAGDSDNKSARVPLLRTI